MDLMSNPEPLRGALAGFTLDHFLYSTYLPIGFLTTGQQGPISQIIHICLN